MLPFLQPKRAVSVIVSKRGKTPDVEVNPEVEAPGSDLDPGLKEAMEDFLRAYEQKSPIDMAKAFQAAFDCCESYPHEENESEEQEQ